MATYFIHIGYGKTGSTALQSFLARNRKLLKKHGFLYPDFTWNGISMRLENHNEISACILDSGGQFRLPGEYYFNQIRETINNTNLNVIISAEGFSGYPNVLLYGNEASFRLAEANYIEKLRSFVGDNKIKIIVYLRNQIDWLESMANQRIKYDGRNDGPRFSTIEKFFHDMSPRLNYFDSLLAWEKYFGRGNIILRTYDIKTLNNNNIIYDFMDAIDCNLPDEYISRKTNSGGSNPGLSSSVINFAIENRKLLDTLFHPEVKGDLLVSASSTFSGKKHRFISAEIGRAISEDYDASNHALYSHFCNDGIPPSFEMSNRCFDNEAPDASKSKTKDIQIWIGIFKQLASIHGLKLILKNFSLKLIFRPRNDYYYKFKLIVRYALGRGKN